MSDKTFNQLHPRAPRGTFEVKMQSVPDFSVEPPTVKVGEPDGHGDRVVTLSPGGLIVLDGSKSEFWNDNVYDTLTIEHAGTEITAHLSVDGFDLTENSGLAAATLQRHPQVVADTVAEHFDHAWLDEDWESNPEATRLNIPVRFDRMSTFNGGLQFVSTNGCVEALEQRDSNVTERALELFAADLRVRIGLADRPTS